MTVSANTKGRWVRASRAAGMKLTDWITEIIEAHMKQQAATLSIPDTVSFTDLRLARDPDGHVSFDWASIEAICRENRLPIELLHDGPEDNVAGLITQWYMAHLAAGGERDATADDLIAEALAEDAAGPLHSHRPGRA